MMPENSLNSVQNPQPVWKRKLQRVGREFGIWNRNLFYSMVEILILCAATAIIFVTVISFLKVLWHMYLQTPVGRKFTMDMSLLAEHRLAQLLDKDLMLFSIEVTVTALVACLALSAICQMLALRRLLYEGHGLVNRFMWAFVFSAASAYGLFCNSHNDFPVAFAICFLPSMCMFATCMTVSARLLPELTPGGVLELTRRFIDFVIRPES
jgi:hypothetical protein